MIRSNDQHIINLILKKHKHVGRKSPPKKYSLNDYIVDALMFFISEELRVFNL